MGSVLGLERPYISSLEESAMEGKDEFCLEYGSATHLYLVPSTLQEERVDVIFCCSFSWVRFLHWFLISPMWSELFVLQVCVALSQNQCQGSKLLGSAGVSQVTLPRDAEGSIDFSNYPFRVSRS